MRRDNTITFVEVKARRDDQCGGPLAAVHVRKQRELGKSARVWVDRYGCSELNYRFDVVGVLISDSLVRIAHVPNAFPLI